MSARRKPIVNGGSELVEGTGVLLSVGVDIGDEAEGLILFQQHVVFEHQAVHVGGHEAAIGIFRTCRQSARRGC